MAILGILDGLQDLGRFHGPDRNLPRRTRHHLGDRNCFTVYQAAYYGHTHSQPRGSLIERENVSRRTSWTIGEQLVVAPQRVHPCLVPGVARTGSHP